MPARFAAPPDETLHAGGHVPAPPVVSGKSPARATCRTRCVCGLGALGLGAPYQRPGRGCIPAQFARDAYSRSRSGQANAIAREKLMLRNINRFALVTIVGLTALLLTSGIEAQTNMPIFDDEIVASVQDGDTTWVAPSSLAQELAAETGQTPTISTMDVVLDDLPDGSTGHKVRFEGGYAAGNVPQSLIDRGYGSSSGDDPELPSAEDATVHEE